MRKLLLALPLASLVFAAGCSCAFKEDCNTCTSVAVAEAPVSTKAVMAQTKSGDVLTMEQYQKLLAEGKVTPLPGRTNVVPAPAVAAAPKVEKVEPIIVTETRVEPVVAKQVVKEEKKTVAVRQPAPRKAAPVQQSITRTPAGVMTIPGMPLPEGWSYIHEEDLTNGKVNREADQLYSQAASEKSGS